MSKRHAVLVLNEDMPEYLLKPEVNSILDCEPNPAYRLIIDLIWSTGGRVSEILALTPERFLFDGHDFIIKLDTLKSRGRPKKKSVERSPKRLIPLFDEKLKSAIQTFLYVNKFRKGEKIFKVCRQTVNRRIKRAAIKADDFPFAISSHTFRHSFAIHLVLHGRPLKYISQLLGHSSIKSTEIYTNVLTVDGSHFMKGIDFH
ncbi:site-specific integrase [Kangiella sp. HZ709]|uniref:tyrosine-type recombinase/integrase n=1 Tax=Kangiella sp. HZ709 TaxID=2666328 RepID=UPI001D0DAD6B|nr:site-specific integrase [Kangiella sp. HZ709]